LESRGQYGQNLPQVFTTTRSRSPCGSEGDFNYYHFDRETLTCLPFKYTGCGGNANNFKESFSCTRNCIPMDYHNCAANSPPVKRADGSYLCNNKANCPKGSTCIKGFVIGLCCDDKEYGNFLQMTLFGKTCEHQFCPEGAECHQGAFFAYCCQ
uniref:BPTI/Kunitz inhibitor domain-containing protein n=1 Tax=Angiostrongylus costaricensis TaxID=334426 RepID=A0A0R3PI40_ANGCS